MSLAKTNKYLRTEEQRTAVVQRNARASSIFEGASPRSLNSVSTAVKPKKCNSAKSNIVDKTKRR